MIHAQKKLRKISLVSLKQTLTIVWAVALMGLAPTALAVDYSAQINALNQQIANNQSAASQKSAQANTLANKVAILNSEISAAQATLNKTRAESTQTQVEIEAQTAELAKQTDYLRQNLQTMYKERDVTPIEILASSENLSDFVGKQQYMQDVKSKIESSIASITTLKAQLEAKRIALAERAEQEKGQVIGIANKRSEQQQLLAQTKGEEAAYQGVVKQNQSQLTAVFAARAEEIRRNQSAGGSFRAGGACGGGYPSLWCNAPIDRYVDDYGYYSRECVSYVAWKRDTIGRFVPRYWGNAKQWWGRGPAGSGTSNPQRGDVAVWTAGPYGHVAIVESVNAGSITVSEYNYSAPGGAYSERTIPNSQLGGVWYVR